MVSVEKVSLSDIVPNRYRKIEKYKIDLTKIERLIQSYKSSGFWDGSIQARPHPDQPGKFEIAFGHHRVLAALQAKIRYVGLVVGERSDADMLHMMADENAEEFKHDAVASSETIGAVIGAYDRGEIKLDSVHPETPKSGVYEVFPSGKTYTIMTVARFLGWTKDDGAQATNACRVAFDLWHQHAAVQDAVMSVPPDKRSSEAVETIQTAARAAKVAAKKANLSPQKSAQAQAKAAQDTAKEVSKSGAFKARKHAKAIGNQAAKSVAPQKVKGPTPIEVFAAKAIKRCNEEALNPHGKVLTSFEEMEPYLENISKEIREKVADALSNLNYKSSKYLSELEDAFRTGTVKKITKLIEG